VKRIGVLHYQVGRTDGVSLEITKWKRVLEELGHKVYLCAGDLGTSQGTLIEEIYHHRPEAERLYYNTFSDLRDYSTAEAYGEDVERLAAVIQRKIQSFVVHNEIDFLIPQNIWSVAVHPPVSVALARVVRELRLPALAHHHDFYWERAGGLALTCAPAIELADKYLPPRDSVVRHVVINSLAQRELAERKGIRARVVPNTFDFDAPAWHVDEYNRDFRSRIGLKENDILILQATRIIRRKGIELAVDFVKALGSRERRARLQRRGLYDGRAFDTDGRIVLVLAGYSEDRTGHYLGLLRQKIERTGVDALFIGDLIDAHRQLRNGKKIYSLWDTYVFADFITYPSLWEGWGNQFLEALQARVPLMIYEYPVYQADIKDKGFEAISLGSDLLRYDDLGLAQVGQAIVEAAADEAVELLTDAERRRAIVERNLQLGRRYYSLQALRGYLEQLVPS